MTIHPTALVDPGAQLGEGISIGPFAIIESGAVLGDHCQIAGHAQLLGHVHLGPRCQIGPGAILGGLPQDRTFDPETASGVELGPDNDIREHVTIHRSTQPGGMTTMGKGNLLMVGSHLGHDCHLGNGNILANHCLLGGHVTMGNGAFLGGGSVFHQFVRIGDLVLTQGQSGFSLDLAPYVMASEINVVTGINAVGLRRAGFDRHTRLEIKELFRLFFRARLPLQEALVEAESRAWNPPAQRFLEFMRVPSRKGICRRSSRES